MDENQLAVGYMEKPYKVIRANTGGIGFKLIGSRGRQFFNFDLLKKDCIHKPAYTITLSDYSTLLDHHKNENITFEVPDFHNHNTHKFWLTWFNGTISLGKWKGPALLAYSEVNAVDKSFIGFIRFETFRGTGELIEWNVEYAPQRASPVFYSPMAAPKHIEGGELRWVKMKSSSKLPIDALIGGLEDEPIYIARATHRGSLCPGKYIKSKKLAFVPWGHEEFSKKEFEVLCGYDAIWVKCKGTHIPENAFIAGHSEVRQQPLFIGRAWIQNNLIVGKVHLMYKTCYLPFRGREVERVHYEILVVGNRVTRGEVKNSSCLMNMIMQPCV